MNGCVLFVPFACNYEVHLTRKSFLESVRTGAHDEVRAEEREERETTTQKNKN